MFEKGCDLDRGASALRGYRGSSWQELQILSPASFLRPGTRIYCYYPLLVQLLLVNRDAREAKASSSPSSNSPILPWSWWPNSSAHCCLQARRFCATSPGWLSSSQQACTSQEILGTPTWETTACHILELFPFPHQPPSSPFLMFADNTCD